MIVWKFYITLKKDLSKEEVEEFRKKFPDLKTEVDIPTDHIFVTTIRADNENAALFLFRNLPGIYPVIGDKAVEEIHMIPHFESRTIYQVGKGLML